MYNDQNAYEIRFEWGLSGLQALAPESNVVIIVDVLSFTTSVDIAVGNGAVVFPYRGTAEALQPFAASAGAIVARHGRQPGAGYSLSPSSLVDIPAGTRIVLPSPNGSKLSLAAGTAVTLAGCLRNATAVAARASQLGRRISVIAAGERWPDGSLRPGLEDLLGAGAILAQLTGSTSPEAETAVAAFNHARGDLRTALQRCGSGRELIERGFAEDVVLAAQFDASDNAPCLTDGAYQH